MTESLSQRALVKSVNLYIYAHTQIYIYKNKNDWLTLRHHV